MTTVQRHEILLALLTSLVNNVANIPRWAPLALLTNYRCTPATLVVLARGHLPMSVLAKTFNILFAAFFAAACIATPVFAARTSVTDLDTGESLSSVYQKKQFNDQWHWTETLDNGQNWVKGDGVGIERDGVEATHIDMPPPKDYKKQVKDGFSPTRMAAAGFILPDGRYSWDGRTGVVPNPTLAMPGYTTPFKTNDSGYGPIKDKMFAAIDPSGLSQTLSVTNWEFSTLAAATSEMANEMRADPKRWRAAMETAQNTKQQATADNEAAKAETNMDTGYDNTYLPLINIANENAWEPCDPSAQYKKYQNVAWMVGRMYKEVYIPMAILFLLPGAMLTQLKVVIRTGFFFGGNDEDSVSPWSGVMRAMIAIFLIPATQLFVSYTIDVGNSLTYEVTRYKMYDMNIVKEWRNDQTYDVKRQNHMNYIPKIAEDQFQGKYRGTKEKQTKLEKQHFAGMTGQQWFNTLGALMGQGMVCLNAFQFVMILYLFLLGPIAAALFAWPGIARETFKKVFANWMNGVVLVTLWKFWWSIILLCMSVRLAMISSADGRLPPPEDSFEMFMAAAFGAMLMYIPFNPFDFRPGDLVSSVLEKAQQQTSKGGGGAAAVGSAGGAGGGGGGGGGQNAGVSGGVGGE